MALPILAERNPWVVPDKGIRVQEPRAQSHERFLTPEWQNRLFPIFPGWSAGYDSSAEAFGDSLG